MDKKEVKGKWVHNKHKENNGDYSTCKGSGYRHNIKTEDKYLRLNKKENVYKQRKCASDVTKQTTG
jgi:hypothetical protein